MDEKEKPYAAFSYLISFSGQEYDKNSTKFKDEAFKFPVIIDNKTILLKDLIDKIKSFEIPEISVKLNTGMPQIDLENVNGCIKNNECEQILYFIKYFLTKENFYYSEVDNNSIFNTFKFSREDHQPVSDQKFKKIIQEKNGFSLSSIGCRKVFPAWNEYRKLAIKKNFEWVDLYQHDAYQNDYFVLPLDFRYEKTSPEFYESSDAFNQWVYNHRKDIEVTFEQIKALNSQLIEHIKRVLGD